MRRVLENPASLPQRFHHQRDISLLQVSHTTVQQFRAATGSAFPEIASLQQQNIIASRGGIYRDAGAGGSSSE